VTQQAEMRGNDAQRDTFQFQVGDHGASGLEPRQTDLLHTLNDVVPRQDHVSMPAMALGVLLEVHRAEAGSSFKRGQIEQAPRVAAGSIRFLQRNQVGIDLSNDFGNAAGIEQPVRSDAFVHIIGSNDRARGIVMELDVLGPIVPECLHE
jgi:hypothetical protein